MSLAILHSRAERGTDAPARLETVGRAVGKSVREVGDDLPEDRLRGLEIIDFNAWQYASAEALWRAFILKITQRLSEYGRFRNSYRLPNRP